ncbi:50S ribosomal protein L14e [Candidatus Woesearchaeota archaeon]|nr:50S ribosomal protein L14e [Candidatus Woesearchaeota archaeon]
MLFEIGRVCVKLAGRDAGQKCIVIDNVDANTVLIDGETRRRKCNVKHLEPLDQVVKISKGADASAVAKAAKEAGFVLVEKSKKKESKKSSAAPKRTRKKKAAPVKKIKNAPIPKKTKDEKVEAAPEKKE